MMKKHKYSSWRIRLILVIGVLGGLALGFFSVQVATMSGYPLGLSTLSWNDGPESANAATVFKTEAVMQKQISAPELPLIDQARPEETEFALFALG